MPTKKQQQAFYEDALQYIIKAGAKNTHEGGLCTHYVLKTIAGDLKITLEEPEKSAVFTIFCRFDDVAKACEVITDGRLNRYSGKWNWHEYDHYKLIHEFERAVNKLLLPELIN